MLDQKIIAELKEKLLEEKARLEKDLRPIANKEDGEYQATSEELGRDQEENAEELEELTNNAGITDVLEKNLKDIEEALQRIEAGTYGFCVNCPGEEIPVERLRAYPAAKTCLKCQK